MYIRWKRGICLSFLIFEVLGCYLPPISRPVPTVKSLESSTTHVIPHKKWESYTISQLDRYFVRDWKYIVIHHSASTSGSAAEFDKYHREKRRWENGLGYHFVIGNGNGTPDGEIEIGNRWINQINGAHAGVEEYNHYGIGICLVGNFNESYPTAAQMASLSILVEYLQDRCQIPSEQVIMHRHCRQTECPGRKFPYDKLLANTYF
ncbi:MAG: N-acetylmuramoyl-L-alanine amidase [Candidatus Brocadia sp.]|nr:MAG: N-acetylmuramoyl-L-alanine amidase [Candidatus Brocadia sp.]